MIAIGLVGGVASGKSLVAGEFKKLGAGVLHGDSVGHEVLELPHVRDSLVARWGTRVLAGDGSIDRNVVASIVFAPAGCSSSETEQELQFLESITHPEIGKILNERLEALRASEDVPAVVIDAAVMIKAGWDAMCDQVVFVDVPVELRRQRAQQRGLAPEQFDAREARQTPIAEKRNRANFMIDNSGSPQNTARQVEQVWHALLQIA